MYECNGGPFCNFVLFVTTFLQLLIPSAHFFITGISKRYEVHKHSFEHKVYLSAFNIYSTELLNFFVNSIDKHYDSMFRLLSAQIVEISKYSSLTEYLNSSKSASKISFISCRTLDPMLRFPIGIDTDNVNTVTSMRNMRKQNRMLCIIVHKFLTISASRVAVSALCHPSDVTSS